MVRTKGEFADRAPDIMMVPAGGYSLAHAKSPIEDADWVSGGPDPDSWFPAARTDPRCHT